MYSSNDMSCRAPHFASHFFMKLKFTLTDYISDELARHVPKKSADESTTKRKQKFYKIVFKREREVISKMK